MVHPPYELKIGFLLLIPFERLGEYDAAAILPKQATGLAKEHHREREDAKLTPIDGGGVSNQLAADISGLRSRDLSCLDLPSPHY